MKARAHVFGLLLALFSNLGMAQSYRVDWHQIGNAGGTSSGGSYTVAGAIGQPTIDRSSAGRYSVETGFFAAILGNLAPLAALDIVTRAVNEDFKIEIKRLLANDRDPDGDAMTISIPSFTANGVPLTTLRGWVYYNHIDDQPDSFVYTVTDSHGATSQATVNIQIGDRDSQFTTLLQIAVDETGARISFYGIPNRIYTVQFRDTLENPWQDAGSANQETFGRYDFIDSVGSETRFYRVVYRE